MCRFMIVKSETPIRPRPLLEEFAVMCRRSKAFDGDWQGDGWGIAFVSGGCHAATWDTYKSIRPVWEDRDAFKAFPPSRLFAIHARSASFPSHTNGVAFNQPYIDKQFAFVFNGLVKGVSFPFPVEGSIGSQKIWTILSRLLARHKPQEALTMLKDMLLEHARTIQALNIGLSDTQIMYAYCHFTQHPEYYRLHYHDSPCLKIVASEPVSGLHFRPARADEVIAF